MRLNFLVTHSNYVCLDISFPKSLYLTEKHVEKRQNGFSTTTNNVRQWNYVYKILGRYASVFRLSTGFLQKFDRRMRFPTFVWLDRRGNDVQLADIIIYAVSVVGTMRLINNN